MEKILKLAQEQKQYMVEMRQHFHMHPESSFQEYETTKRVVEELKKMGLEPQVLAEGRGVICDIKGAKPGKTILLRADMDALEVTELNDVPYKSTVEGKMHACGHDGHTATLLGVAKVLVQLTGEMKGAVRLCFQPAEEIGKGAKAMIADGCLKGVDATFGAHLWSGVPTGKISCEAGPRMAAANCFRYHIKGKPGHGALPHQGVDAGLAACAAVLGLQSLVSREYSPLEPIVITCGQIHAGTRFNVIAAEAMIEGTLRCFNKEIYREMMHTTMPRMVRDVAAAYRCEFSEDETGTDLLPVVNPVESAARCEASVTKLFGAEALQTFGLNMVGEDFAFYMDAIPDSEFVFVGTGNHEKHTDIPHHAGNFDLDADAFPISCAVYAQYAMDYLSE